MRAIYRRVVFTLPKTPSNPELLVQLLNSEKINVAQATPSTWDLLRMWGWKGNPTLTLLSGGEILSKPLAKYLSQSCNTLWNLYGPTETIVWASAKKITSECKQITIGRPLKEVQFLVRDEQGRELPPGEKGELYISIKNLTRGYHNRPELKAAKYVTLDKALYFRTGDLAIRLTDGDHILCGRIDRQVKIRGNRIELEEIENELLKIEEIQKVVVQWIRNPKQELVAFWSTIPRILERLSEKEWAKSFRKQLSAELPRFMIPNKFVYVKSFPLLTNGKVNLMEFAKCNR